MNRSDLLFNIRIGIGIIRCYGFLLKETCELAKSLMQEH